MPKDTRSPWEVKASAAYQMAYNRQKAPVKLAVCSGDDGQPAGFAQWQVWALKLYNLGKAVHLRRGNLF